MGSILVSSPAKAADPVAPAWPGLLDRPVKPGDGTGRVGDSAAVAIHRSALLGVVVMFGIEGLDYDEVALIAFLVIGIIGAGFIFMWPTNKK
jgi:hypothetical protein